MQTLLKILLLAALAILPVACSSPEATTPATEPPATSTPPPADAGEQTLTLLYWQAPSLPFPYLSTGAKDTDAGAVTLEPLAKYDPEGNLLPALAAQIPSIDNGGISPGLAGITWNLRKGLKWSDGSDLTAEDVVFTWQYCADEATGCTGKESFAGITSVEAVDDFTVKITFDRPTPYPYQAFVGAGSPVISRQQFADCIGAAAQTCEAQNSAPLGTGPYRITGFRANVEALYERNPYYRGAEPYFDRVTLKGGGDALWAARTVLEREEADFAWNMQVDPETLAQLEAEGKGRVASAFSSQVERIIVNQTNPDPALEENRSEYLEGENPHPFLTFLPIRKAMSLAIDRSRIAEELYSFAGKPACNLIVGPPAYVSTANDGCVIQDIAGAKELLEEEGVVDSDGDGIREYQGVPLSITYQTSANVVRQDTQLMIQDWWRQIGIETKLIQHDASLFFGGDPVVNKQESLRRFYADVQMYTGSSGIDPQQTLAGSLCRNIQTRENNWALSNTARACDPEYDELFAELTETPVGPKREEMVKRLNDHLADSYYQIPLVNRGAVSAHLNTLKGVRINGWDSELWNIGEWRR